MANATGSNAGPNRAGRPDAESTDAPMGTTSGMEKRDQRKLATPGKPEKGSRDDAGS